MTLFRILLGLAGWFVIGTGLALITAAYIGHLGDRRTR